MGDGNTNNSYIVVNEINEAGVKEFRNSFEELRTSPFPTIHVVIDSFGGDVYSLLAMIDIFDSSEKPIMTSTIGKAMSSGCVLLACGSKGFRFAAPNSTLMVHDVASLVGGRIDDMKIETEEAERLNEKLFEILEQRCGQKKGYFKIMLKNINNSNLYISPQDALKYGMVDAIGVPFVDSTFSFRLMNDPNQEKKTPNISKKPKKKPKNKNE